MRLRAHAGVRYELLAALIGFSRVREPLDGKSCGILRGSGGGFGGDGGGVGEGEPSYLAM